MASTYSALKIELIGTGEQSGTWGATTNTNLDIALGEVITGSADVAFSSADVTVTLTDTNTAQTARNLRLNLTGTSGGARQLILGSGCQIEKLYLINNNLADAVTIKNTAGTGISVPAGRSTFVFNNGTNVVDATNYLSSLTSPSLNSTGGALNGTIGATTPAAGTFTVGTFTSDSAFTSTGAVTIPVGTTAQQPTGANGKLRYNTSLARYEGYSGAAWGALGGGATGGGSDQVFVENGVTVTTNYTLSTGKNAESVGPITINSGITVTVPSGQRWVII